MKRSRQKELLDRSPPHDLAAEAALIGSVLVSPSLMIGLAQRLVEADLYCPRHRAIWRSMLRLHRSARPIDCTLMVGDLKDHSDYGEGCGGEVTAYFISQLYRLFPSACHLDFYLARVKELARRRKAVERGVQLIQSAHGKEADPQLTPPAIRRARRRTA
jgi:replicative DNA helicase